MSLKGIQMWRGHLLFIDASVVSSARTQLRYDSARGGRSASKYDLCARPLSISRRRQTSKVNTERGGVPVKDRLGLQPAPDGNYPTADRCILALRGSGFAVEG